jgi:peptidyl-prolyl cis-trans isomerase C
LTAAAVYTDMKILCAAAYCLAAAWAQTAPPGPQLAAYADDQVVTIFPDDGYKLTAGELRRVIAAMGKEREASANLEEFLHSYAYLRKLSRIAEKEKLDQESAVKTSLEYQRMVVLATAENTRRLNDAVIESDEIEKYYAANKEKFKQLKTSLIYVAFYKSESASVSSTAKRLLSEEEAKAKAQKLLADLRGGADFAKLARENSEEEATRAKDGFLGNWSPAQFPENAREQVEKLKPGETTEPIREANGYYLFHVETISYRPLSEVQTDIFNELKTQRYAAWAERLFKESKVQIIAPATAH